MAASPSRQVSPVHTVRLRRATLFVIDSVFWLIAVVIVHVLRFGANGWGQSRSVYLTYVIVALVVNAVVGFTATSTYRNGFKLASFEEAMWLTIQYVIVAIMSSLAVIVANPHRPIPYLALIIVGPLALGGSLLARSLVRALRQYVKRSLRGSADRQLERVLIVGAGAAGDQITRLTVEDGKSPYKPVGLVDDDPAKRHLRLSGIPVLGTVSDLGHLAKSLRVKTAIIAINDLPSSRLKEISSTCSESGIKVLNMAPLSSIVGRRVRLDDIRELDLAELLGRSEVQTDISSIAGYLNGRRVLITGAGGSIGSEIARQVHAIGPKELVLLDRDESALHQVQLDIYHKGLLDTRDMVLCDIRDRAALEEIFREHRPEVIFHAAALKHLPMLELYPEEGWKTNVLGTANLLDLAQKYAVGVFVNISTDKAADPTSVLGRTKRLAERLTAYVGQEAPGKFVSVRFGNVLGSRGSMLWTFQYQINSGGPLTVTHPDVERYFMTIPEACQLVLEAGAIGRSGEAMVLDMGEPVRILDVAKRLIIQSGRPVDIVFTGLRPGEKLTEELVASDETDERPFHPLISHVRVPGLAAVALGSEHSWAVQDDVVISSEFGGAE